MFAFSRTREPVGLDIGSHAVKAVELKAKARNDVLTYEVKKIGYELLPRDAIVEGTIVDSTTVAETIKLIFDENKIVNKNVVISISGNSVIIKKITLPVMEEKELAETVIWEAKHNIPYPFEETSIDYCILRPARRFGDQNLEILLVAAKKDKVTNYASVIEQANKSSHAIEIDVFALHNIIEVNYPEPFWNKTLAIINLGAHTTNLIITEKGIPQLFRDLALGGSLITENLSKGLNIGFDEAEKALKGLLLENIQADQYQLILDENIKNIIDEIRKTFSFYEAGQKEEKKVEHIYLCGGLSKMKDMAAKFEEKFTVKTEIANPFRNILLDERKFRGFYMEEMAPHFGVAVGLALRRTEG